MKLFLLCFVMSIPISFTTTYVQGIQVMQQISPAHSTSLKNIGLKFKSITSVKKNKNIRLLKIPQGIRFFGVC